MASTRNKNCSADYKLEQQRMEDSRLYNEYEFSQVGRAYNNAMPDVGITPSHMPRSAFSNNSVDIESALKGINSTNLVKPAAPTVPDTKNIPNIAENSEDRKIMLNLITIILFDKAKNKNNFNKYLHRLLKDKGIKDSYLRNIRM